MFSSHLYFFCLCTAKGRRRLISKATAANSEGGDANTDDKVASPEASPSIEKKTLEEAADYTQSALLEAPAKTTDAPTESIATVSEVPASE